MEKLPDYSIVINATGMGKDNPARRLPWEEKVPQHGIAWEFNYRGELDFLHQPSTVSSRPPEGGRRLAVLRPRLDPSGGPGTTL